MFHSSGQDGQACLASFLEVIERRAPYLFIGCDAVRPIRLPAMEPWPYMLASVEQVEIYCDRLLRRQTTTTWRLTYASESERKALEEAALNAARLDAKGLLIAIQPEAHPVKTISRKITDAFRPRIESNAWAEVLQITLAAQQLLDGLKAIVYGCPGSPLPPPEIGPDEWWA